MGLSEVAEFVLFRTGEEKAINLTVQNNSSEICYQIDNIIKLNDVTEISISPVAFPIELPPKESFLLSFKGYFTTTCSEIFIIVLVIKDSELNKPTYVMKELVSYFFLIITLFFM